MALRASLALGLRKVNRTKRMVTVAWIVNVLVSLVLAGPLLNMLNASIAPTIMEERLTEQLDLNWIQTFRANHPDDPLARMLRLSVFGAAPFYEHLDGVINGNFARSIGEFFGALFFQFRIDTSVLDSAGLLALFYVLAWTYLAGAFIGMYAREQRSTFTEFLQFGGRYFGKFFRLALIQAIIYIALFALVGWVSRSISAWTADEPSELTAYTYFMIRNAAVLAAMGLIVLFFDYAKIRMVVESRVSALAACGAGVRFVVTHPLQTVILGLILALVGVVFTVVFVLLDGQLGQSSFWMIALVFLLQQLYVWARQWLRAAFYASETALYQDATRATAQAEPRPGDVALEAKS